MINKKIGLTLLAILAIPFLLSGCGKVFVQEKTPNGENQNQDANLQQEENQDEQQPVDDNVSIQIEQTDSELDLDAEIQKIDNDLKGDQISDLDASTISDTELGL